MDDVTSIDIGLLVFAVLAWVMVGAAALIAKAFHHDEVFTDVTPGVVPPDPNAAPTHRLRGSVEYNGEMAVAFSPPRGVRPGLMGVVVDGSVDSHDLTATIVDLAVRGHLRIRATSPDEAPNPDRAMFARRAATERPKNDWILTRSDVPTADQLDPVEAHLLAGLFAGGREARMSQLDRTALQAMRDVQAGFYGEVVHRGWYRRHPKQRGFGLGWLAIIIGVVLAILFVVAGQSVSAVIAAALVFAASIALGRVTRGRTPRTALGSAIRIQSEGFKKYLATAEAEQFSFEEASGIFSRYLPYAMVLGVAQHWSKVFSQVAKDARLAGWDPGTNAADLMWLDAGDMFVNLLWLDSLDGSLDMFGGLAEGLGDLGGFAADGVGDLASGVGDFVGSLDFLDGVGDGCGDLDGCIDL